MTTNIIKIGAMPGRINDFALSTDTTIEEALQEAGLSAEGFEVKMDSESIVDLNEVIGDANVLLLTKKVKGNSKLTKVGAMPGRIEDYAFEEGTTVEEALEVAGLSAEGFEVKLDGSTVTDLNTTVDDVNVVLLTKKVKGN